MYTSSLLATEGQSKQKKTIIVGSVALLLVVSLATVSYAFSDFLGTKALTSAVKPTAAPSAAQNRAVAAIKVPVVNLAYYDAKNQDLKYAYNIGGAWSIARIDAGGNVGQDTTIAVDGKGKMHIGYYDVSQKDLKYATNASGSWVVASVDTGGDVGWFPSLALDSNNNPYIAYYDTTNRDLKWATRASGKWVTSVVDAGVTKYDVPGRYVSLAFDKQNRANIGYQYLSGPWAIGLLKYATYTGGKWVTSIVDSEANAGFGVALKVDSMGKTHMSYLGNKFPKYANNISGKWAIKQINTDNVAGSKIIGFNTSLALDAKNTAHMCYVMKVSAVKYSLKCFSNVGGNVTGAGVFDQGKIGTFNALGVDELGKLYVSFYDETKQSLNLASKTADSWQTYMIDGDNVGTWGSLAISYNFEVPPSPPQPYGPYGSNTPTPTPPMPYSGAVSPVPTPPAPYTGLVTPTPTANTVTAGVDLVCPPPYVDVNGDGQLTSADYQPFIAFGPVPQTPQKTGAVWQNQLNPLDVNADGVVNSVDASLALNAVNKSSGRISDRACVPLPYAGR